MTTEEAEKILQQRCYVHKVDANRIRRAVEDHNAQGYYTSVHVLIDGRPASIEERMVFLEWTTLVGVRRMSILGFWKGDQDRHFTEFKDRIFDIRPIDGHFSIGLYRAIDELQGVSQTHTVTPFRFEINHWFLFRQVQISLAEVGISYVTGVSAGGHVIEVDMADVKRVIEVVDDCALSVADMNVEYVSRVLTDMKRQAELYAKEAT